MALQIRPYTEGDLDDLLRIWQAAAQAAHPFFPPDHWPRQRAAIQAVYLPRAEVYMAALEGVSVGFVALIEGEVAGLFVAPSFEHRGVGRALLSHAMAVQNGLTLQVFSENKRGLQFAEDMGFVADEEVRHAMTGHAAMKMVLGADPGEEPPPTE